MMVDNFIPALLFFVCAVGFTAIGYCLGMADYWLNKYKFIDMWVSKNGNSRCN